MEPCKRKMDRKTKRKNVKEKAEKYCRVCQAAFSDSSLHYASLQHTIKVNMRHEEKTFQEGLKKVSKKRRAYKEAMKRASLSGVMDSDESAEERNKSRKKRRMTKESIFVLQTLNARKVKPIAYKDSAPKQVASDHSLSSQSVIPLSSQSNQSCELNGNPCAVDEGENANPAERELVTNDRVIPSTNNSNFENNAPTAEPQGQEEGAPHDATQKAQLKKEIYDKVAELGSLILKSGTNFVLCVEKPDGGKCWSTSGSKMEDKLLGRRFGIEKGDVLVDVLKKKDRDAELVAHEFDPDDPRPNWIDEDFDEFPEVPDPLATRTLLVENIADLVQRNCLEDTFRQFGIVDNIIVNYDDSGSPFALLFFPHVAMAYDAKMSLSLYDRPVGAAAAAANHRGVEISFLHLEMEQTRGKEISLVNEKVGGEATEDDDRMTRKKIILDDIPKSKPMTESEMSALRTNRRYDTGRVSASSVSASRASQEPVHGNTVGEAAPRHKTDDNIIVKDAELRNLAYYGEAYFHPDYYKEMGILGDHPADEDNSQVSIVSRILSNSLNSSARDPTIVGFYQNVVPVKNPPIKELFPDYNPMNNRRCAGPASAAYAPSFEDCQSSKDVSRAASSRYRSAALAYLDGNDYHLFNPGFKSSTAGSVLGLPVPDDRISEREQEEGLLQTSLSGASNKVYSIPVITTSRKSMAYDENANDVTCFKSALNNYRMGFM